MKTGKRHGKSVSLARESRERRVKHTLGAYERATLQALYPQDER
jgi:hypothetical protein